MDFKNLLRALLSKVYKKTDTEIEAILGATDEATAEAQLTQLDAARVSELSKPKPGSTFQDGYAKAKKEVLTERENALKEAFDIEETEGQPLTGDALISAIVEKKAAGVTSKELSKLSTEDIKKLPGFQPIAREHTTALNNQKKELEGKISEIETGYKKQEVFGNVSKAALNILNGLNPVLDKSETVAANRKSSFLNSLKDGIEWQQQGDVFVPIDKDGKTLVDAHGNVLTLQDLAKAKASEWFEFSANNGGGNAGNGKAGENSQSQQGGGKGIVPKNIEEYASYVQDSKNSLEDKQATAANWERAQKEGTPA